METMKLRFCAAPSKNIMYGQTEEKKKSCESTSVV